MEGCGKNEEALKGLLGYLGDVDLFSLADTVTDGLTKKNHRDRNDAVSIIIQHSPDDLSILKRKVVTRDILFSYLNDKQVPITLPITKNKLIERILSYWKDGGVAKVESSPEKNVGILAQEFSKWFYSQVNNNDDIIDHFYADSKCKLNYHQNNDTSTMFYNGDPESFCEQFKVLRREHNVVFNPNMTNEGCQGRIDPHGLVIVVICGTLHVVQDCVGVFEQVFGLARDPYTDNNWKIKTTEVNIRRQAVQCEPSLMDCELTGNVLSLSI